MVTTLYLVRHAESRPDHRLPEPFWPLSATGRAQALALAPFLHAAGIRHVYSSTFPRAIDTVRPFAEGAGLEIHLEHDVRERKLAEGMLADWYAVLERAWRDFDYALPGAESSRDAQGRMLTALGRIAARHEGETVAVATHGNVIALALYALDASFGFEQWKTIRNPDVLRLCWSSDKGLWWDRSFRYDRSEPDLGVPEPKPPETLVQSSLLSVNALLPRLARHYDLANASGVLLHHGFNDSYLVRAEGREYVARIYKYGWRAKDHVTGELRLLVDLAKDGLPVSAPLPTKDGALTFTVAAPEGERLVALFAKAEGNLPLGVDAELAARLGALLARLHLALDGKADSYARPRLDAPALVDAPLSALRLHFPEQEETLAALENALGPIRRELQEAAQGARPSPEWGLVHGDFLSVNFFVAPHGGLTLFDFDFCGLGLRAYDLATFKWALLTSASEEAEPLYAAFERAYRDAGGPALSPKLVDDLVTVRHLWVWGVGVAYGEDFRRLNVHSFRHRLGFLAARLGLKA